MKKYLPTIYKFGNLDFNFSSLKPNGVVIYIIPDVFVSSLICLIHNSRLTSVEVFIHLINLGLGLHICQTWKLLVYIPEGLCHSSQCPNVHS